MKIVFLCGSLQQGQDGVGDYTRRLGIELIRHDHQVAAIALNDFNITEVDDSIQCEDSLKFRVLRIPSIEKRHTRFNIAGKWITEFDPDILSLQFVSFSFHNKGISFTLNKCLRFIGKGRRWHIMFHELWVGMETRSKLKLLAWGVAQKGLIKDLIRNLKPDIIHTQAKLYQMQLAKLGYNARYLPLFSNIKVVTSSGNDLISDPDSIKAVKIISLVLFGGIHPGAPIKQFAQEASIYAKQNKVQIILKIVGRCGNEQRNWEKEWRSAGLHVEVMGEHSAENVSLILKSGDAGISTTPIALAEKSGTIAAMREHGLSVICVRKFWKARGLPEIPAPSGIVEYKVGNFEECLSNIEKKAGGYSVSEVAEIFLKDLSEIK